MSDGNIALATANNSLILAWEPATPNTVSGAPLGGLEFVSALADSIMRFSVLFN